MINYMNNKVNSVIHVNLIIKISVVIKNYLYVKINEK
jgi:hypothetical protein